MEFPLQLTDNLLLFSVALLAIIPLFSLYGAYQIGKVFFNDNERPRNRIIRRMLDSGISISVSGLLISTICVVALIEWFGGKPIDSNFGDVLFVIALIVTGIQPFLNWRALVQLGRHTSRTRWGRKETRNEAEDRQFGIERRKLEVEHAKGGETQNQQEDREVGDAKRETENDRLDSQQPPMLK